MVAAEEGLFDVAAAANVGSSFLGPILKPSILQLRTRLRFMLSLSRV